MARGKDRDDDGPSKNQLRGLSYNHNLPSFLRNAQTALSGVSGQRQNDGRPPIPTRPGDEDDNKLDERDLGDEAPLVVVMDESKDLTAEEAAQAQQDAPPVFDDGLAPAAKRGATLRFSNTDKASNKRKIVGRSYEDEDDTENGVGASESFNDLVKRAKVDPNNATTVKELPTSSVSKPVKKDTQDESKKEKKQLSKEEKAAMKAKRKSAKKLLSFED